MKKIIIITCLLLANYVLCFAHTAKIGRFECMNGTRMSVYAYGVFSASWDYIYVDSPWAAPFCIEKKNIDAFLSYTIEAAKKYKQWTEEVEKVGNVSMYHKHIDFYPNVFVLYNINYYKYGIEKMHVGAQPEKLSYDFFVNKIGGTLLECNIVRAHTSYNNLSFYMDENGLDDFIYVLQHATERYVANPNMQTDKLLDEILK